MSGENTIISNFQNYETFKNQYQTFKTKLKLRSLICLNYELMGLFILADSIHKVIRMKKCVCVMAPRSLTSSTI